MPHTRSRTLAFAGLLVAALGCLAAGSQPWWRAVGDGTPVTFTGTDATAGLTAALGVVILAGTVLALALRRVGRRVLAVVLVLAGAAVVAVGALRLRPGAAAVTEKVRQVSLMDDYRLTGTPWNYVYAAAGLITVAAAVTMLLRAGRWPQRADRFARAEAGGDRSGVRQPVELADPETDPSQWWKAQDAGLDPTALRPSSEADEPDQADEPDEHDQQAAAAHTADTDPGRERPSP